MLDSPLTDVPNHATVGIAPTIAHETVPAADSFTANNLQRDSADQRITALIEAVPDGLVIVNNRGIIVSVNRQTEALFGYERSELINQPIELLLPHRHRYSHVAHRDNYIHSPHTRPMGVGMDLTGQHKDGHEIPVEVSLSPLPQADSIDVICSIRDSSARKAAEAERTRLQNEVIQAQRSALRELSTPLIPLTDQIVIMPLIGAIDSWRAQDIIERLLGGVSQHRTQVAIIDITGVAVVDTQVANILIQAAQAVRLLGARTILTGMRPEIAQTMVGLGISLTDIETKANLQTGIAAALDAVGQSSHSVYGVRR